MTSILQLAAAHSAAIAKEQEARSAAVQARKDVDAAHELALAEFSRIAPNGSQALVRKDDGSLVVVSRGFKDHDEFTAVPITIEDVAVTES